MAGIPVAPGGRGEQEHGTPVHHRLTSPEAVAAHGELTPPAKPDLLTGWPESRGGARASGCGRDGGAAGLGLAAPAARSPRVQRALAQRDRLHRNDLPSPEAGLWSAASGTGQGQSRKATDADPD